MVIALTSDQIKALKKADTISFVYKDGQSSILAKKRIKKGAWEGEQQVEINCGTELWGRTDKLGNIKGALFTEMFPQENETLRTALSKLRKGDKLILKWWASCNNEYLNRADLYHDMLFLVVEKPNGKKDTYYIYSNICANNSAKMIVHELTPSVFA